MLTQFPLKSAAELGVTPEELAQQTALAEEIMAEILEEERRGYFEPPFEIPSHSEGQP